ncbi:uncharacterized protein MYCFIDRAFT_77300 [Pseudocercospora fijiensis CIRAD86]|uniref:Uncharacterized protein n=1 Tax=Pseudocercospora fijiensis (strain CIRAD86) TaxID=383855 RepID=M3A739_PSEFD|nr:uncharacterized protein MYCFIDRAFT_77300 [Pseudocercospora fijiensis CIRAD86]EME86904.1 hypothetical protein MYCFIDRAFT_77300 [Pseudocercospora fijiensis CIRAD86]
MPKRRRERDRPKAGPESAYNPNKRVLLSYGSDDDEPEEITEHQDVAVQAELEGRNIANYQMTEYPDSDSEVGLGAQPEGTEQTETHLATAEAAEGEAVGEEEETPSRPSEGWRNDARKNHETNQYTAVGMENEDDGYDSTTEEAMAYLRTVKNERQAIPEILSASHPDITQLDEAQHEPEEETDEDGYMVEDGTYIGRPVAPVATAEDDTLDPQRAFTESLKDRFYIQRDQLHILPSAEKVAALGEHHPISFPQGNNKAYAEWHRLLSSKPPKAAQLQSLDQDSVFNLLALLQKTYLIKGRNLRNVTSAWVWSLLARLDDVGSMSNDQVYPLRELGKKAIFLQLHFSNPEAAAQLETLQQGEAVGNEANGSAEISTEYDTDGVAIKATAQSSSSHSDQPRRFHAVASENTLATLDMILVVIGDIFGQRDLLEFRQPWSKAAPAEEAVAD